MRAFRPLRRAGAASVGRRRAASTLPSTSATDGRLARVRAACAAQGLDAFVVPSGDPHLAEYPPLAYHRRAWLSGFNGSAGTAAVTQTAAALWTDGRYFLQAELQLQPPEAWELQREGATEPTETPTLARWLVTQQERLIEAGAAGQEFVVGIDPEAHSQEEIEKLQAELLVLESQAAQGAAAGCTITVKPLAVNPIDALWEPEGRPAFPGSPVRLHTESAGRTVSEKLSFVAEELSCVPRGAGEV